jgi:Ca2+/Na+ antiporter
MYELALVETMREAFGEIWSSLQWWASVSFGLIAVASLGRDRLNLLVTIGLTALYSLFTVYTLGNGSLMIAEATGAIQELAALRDSGELSAVGALTLQQYENPWAGLNFSFVFFGCFVATYVGSVAYLWYSYRKMSRSAQARSRSVSE